MLGIQGTQLGKLGGKDINFELMAREEERREIANAVQAVAQENPAEALAMLEGYRLADPGARYSPEVLRASDYVYDRAALEALVERFADAVTDIEPQGTGTLYAATTAHLSFDGGRVFVVIDEEPTSFGLGAIASLAAVHGFQGVLFVHGHSNGWRFSSSLAHAVPLVQVLWRW